MIITANFYQKITIDPKDIIEKLLENEVGVSDYKLEKIDGKYIKTIFNSNRADQFYEITEENYEYINALKTVLKNLK